MSMVRSGNCVYSQTDSVQLRSIAKLQEGQLRRKNHHDEAEHEDRQNPVADGETARTAD